MDRVEQMNEVQEEALKLFIKKNADYGDTFADYGPVGVLIRMGDKIRRLSSITKNKVSLVQDEKMRDTLLDLHNYAAMAIMLLDEQEVAPIGCEEPKEARIKELISLSDEFNNLVESQKDKIMDKLKTGFGNNG